MKIQSINRQIPNNTNFKGANKYCKYSIRTFIASTTMFMVSGAVDTFQSEKIADIKPGITTIASILGIAGTGLGIFGIEKIENENKHK